MARNFPVFVDISDKKIVIYGCGQIASRRAGTLLLFGPRLTVVAPKASSEIRKRADRGELIYIEDAYRAGSVPGDAYMVLAATDDAAVNEQIFRECRQKKIPVNVCSDQRLCDFQFPGIVVRDELVVGVNAGGTDHALVRKWAGRIRKEVEEDGDDSQAEEASHFGES